MLYFIIFLQYLCKDNLRKVLVKPPRNGPPGPAGERTFKIQHASPWVNIHWSIGQASQIKPCKRPITKREKLDITQTQHIRTTENWQEISQETQRAFPFTKDSLSYTSGKWIYWQKWQSNIHLCRHSYVAIIYFACPVCVFFLGVI